MRFRMPDFRHEKPLVRGFTEPLNAAASVRRSGQNSAETAGRIVYRGSNTISKEFFTSGCRSGCEKIPAGLPTNAPRKQPVHTAPCAGCVRSGILRIPHTRPANFTPRKGRKTRQNSHKEFFLLPRPEDPAPKSGRVPLWDPTSGNPCRRTSDPHRRHE